jgi:hypothetical protein
MANEQALQVDWKALSVAAGRRMGFGARLWFFAIGVIALFAPGMCLVVFMRIISKVIAQGADDAEEIVTLIRALGAE